jgi:hypothetical protein
VDFWFPLLIARKKPEIHFSTPEAGLPGQNPIERTQKHGVLVLGVFGHFPKISKLKTPVRQKII